MNSILPAQSYLSRIRGVPMLPDEKVAQVLSLEDGLLTEPSPDGLLLVATNRRVLYFARNRDWDETSLFPVEELRGVTLNSTEKGSFSWLRALLLSLGALVFYLVVSYWLVARVSSPAIPLINMDAVPLLLLVLMLVGAWFFASRYIHRPGGSVTLHGGDWTLPIVYQGSARIPDVQVWVNALFLCREIRRQEGEKVSPSQPPL